MLVVLAEAIMSMKFLPKFLKISNKQLQDIIWGLYSMTFIIFPFTVPSDKTNKPPGHGYISFNSSLLMKNTLFSSLTIEVNVTIHIFIYFL